jgi:hypothetical protein
MPNFAIMALKNNSHYIHRAVWCTTVNLSLPDHIVVTVLERKTTYLNI